MPSFRISSALTKLPWSFCADQEGGGGGGAGGLDPSEKSQKYSVYCYMRYFPLEILSKCNVMTI